MPAKRQNKSKEMDMPTIVRYGGGSWLRDLDNTEGYLSSDTFEWLVNNCCSNDQFEAGMWCLVKPSSRNNGASGDEEEH